MAKQLTTALLVIAACTSLSATAQNKLPEFFTKSMPALTIENTMAAYGKLNGPDSAFTDKQRQLISLAVAAQIPCVYCVHAHYEKALAAGATEKEIKEAVAVAGFVRLISTSLYGARYDLEKYEKEIAKMTGK